MYACFLLYRTEKWVVYNSIVKGRQNKGVRQFLDDSKCVPMSSKIGCFVQSIFGWLCIFRNWMFCIILIRIILNDNACRSSKNGCFVQSIFGLLM